MSWDILYTLVGQVGLYTAVTSIPVVYNITKYIIYGSDANRLENKIDEIVMQNKIMKIELGKIRDNEVIHDDKLKALGYDIVTIYDILDFELKKR